MVTVEKIIAELKIGGYLDAAEYIERQFATINRTAEFGYMKAFIVEGDFSDERYRAQLRALWTALCEQISTVSVERLGNYCGHVSDSELTAIENAMLISLGIQLAPVSEESEETPPPCRNHGSPKSKLGAVSCRSCMTLCWTGSSRLDENIKKPHAARRAA